MMLPTLISVSVAPVSYFFWASALPLVAAKAMTAVEIAAIRSFWLKSIVSPFEFGRSVFLELADKVLGDHRDLSCAMRHEKDDEEQKDAEYGAGQAFRNAFRDVGNEHDEGRSDDRSRQPAHAA